MLMMSQHELYPTIRLNTPIKNLSWVDGKKLRIDVPLLRFSVSQASTDVFFDYLRPAANIPLYSDRLKDILDANGVDNIDYYDAEVVDEAHSTRCHYNAANIIGQLSAVDRQLSDVTPVKGSDLLLDDVEKLVLDEKRLAEILICRLAEYDLLTVVHDRIRTAIESIPARGVVFVKPEDWDGFTT
jgi:hypothetical protein